jgi:ribosomal 50S subunit-recycling heat shock protein
MIESGHLRLNGQRCRKPGQSVMEVDTLTFTQGRDLRVVRVLVLSERTPGASPRSSSALSRSCTIRRCTA